MSEDIATKTPEVATEALVPDHPVAARLRDRFEDEIVKVVDAQEQVTIVCQKDRITDILSFLKSEPDLRYDRLNDVTAVDYQDHPHRAPDLPRFDVVYSLYSHPNNQRLRVRAQVAEDDCRVDSATTVWRGAEWPEREAFDMFGIRFDGHPDLRRILMPHNFQYHPLRKDYPLRGMGERNIIAPEDPGFAGNPFAGQEDADEDPLGSEKMVLNLGPQHPATHGTLRLQLQLDGERISKCIPDIGYLHTGFEKLGEHHTFNQYVTVTDRMNYLSPLCNNIAYAASMELLMGLEVPERATAVRVVLWELSRIADHMVWLGTHALDIGAFTVFLYTFEQRERCYNIFELVTGARLTTSYTRVGGLGWDVPENFREVVLDFIAQFPDAMKEVDRLLTRNRIWVDRTKGIGVISAEDAIDWNMTGPMLRGSGIDYDIRKAEPFLNFSDYDFDVPVGENGDTYDRYLVRMEELVQSTRIVEQAVNNLPEGPVKVDEAKVILPEKKDVDFGMESLIHHFKVIMDGHGLTPPVGESYLPTEAPNGELGFYVVSNGSGYAHRMRVRPPSFMNYQVFSEMAEGLMVSDAIAVLGSFNVIAGELDR
ncbi:MAG TPA: NADH-quinone oxidoreductase subunit D [Candidatus Latescibacteria bacterium]|nr:NADH-quinone oxidoreductase subunit D [Candidatus Latescibacterota bacterium]